MKSFYAKKIQETCGRDSTDEDLRRSDKVQVCTMLCLYNTAPFLFEAVNGCR